MTAGVPRHPIDDLLTTDSTDRLTLYSNALSSRL